jgi:glycosyltransferase involved in cell wall biosynthesis
VVHRLDYGGLQRLVGAIVSHIDRERFESHVMTMSDFGPFAEGLDAVAELHRVASLRRVSMVWPASVIRKIRSIGPDVVHTHSGVWHKASLAARRAGVPRLIHTDHGRHCPDPWTARFLDGLAARRTDVVVAVSEALSRQLADTVVADPTRIRVVLNGVDTCRFHPRAVNGALRTELGISPGVPVIGSIGRLDPIKGYDVMIQALGMLRATWTEGPAPVLILVGDGPDQARLGALSERYGLRDAVRLTGWRKDVENVYAALDVFTLSSWSEGTSLALLEAMSTGVCPIVTDVGGSPSVLGERLRHRLVRPGDRAALADAWRDALRQPDRRGADGAVARERVHEAFGLATMVRQYERIYAGEE